MPSKLKEKRNNYIGNRGYSLIKENGSQAELNDIRRELTVKPFVTNSFQPQPLLLSFSRK